MARKAVKIEFGDFQTPAALAGDVCALLARAMPHPASIVEPSCGTGAFLVAALRRFPKAKAAQTYRQATRSRRNPNVGLGIEKVARSRKGRRHQDPFARKGDIPRWAKPRRRSR